MCLTCALRVFVDKCVCVCVCVRERERYDLFGLLLGKGERERWIEGWKVHRK